jgi:transcriptional regulator with XRE-family HTH domain
VDERTSEVEQAVARRIRAGRQLHGQTIEQLAEAMTAAGCPIKARTLLAMEEGRRGVGVGHLVAIARAWGIPASELLGE